MIPEATGQEKGTTIPRASRKGEGEGTRSQVYRAVENDRRNSFSLIEKIEKKIILTAYWHTMWFFFLSGQKDRLRGERCAFTGAKK